MSFDEQMFYFTENLIRFRETDRVAEYIKVYGCLFFLSIWY